MELFTSNVTFTLIFLLRFLNTVKCLVSILITVSYYSTVSVSRWISALQLQLRNTYILNQTFLMFHLRSFQPHVPKADGHWRTVLASLQPISQVRHPMGSLQSLLCFFHFPLQCFSVITEVCSALGPSWHSYVCSSVAQRVTAPLERDLIS